MLPKQVSHTAAVCCKCRQCTAGFARPGDVRQWHGKHCIVLVLGAA